MAEQTLSLLSDELETYVRAHCQAEDKLLQELRAETQKTLKYPQMQVGPVEGALLRLLVSISSASNVLEIGTFSGYSALCMAAALPGWVLATSSGVGLVAGGLIGCVGVGGVILVPSLIQLPGVGDPSRAKSLIGETARLEVKHRKFNVDLGDIPGPSSDDIVDELVSVRVATVVTTSTTSTPAASTEARLFSLRLSARIS